MEWHTLAAFGGCLVAMGGLCAAAEGIARLRADLETQAGLARAWTAHRCPEPKRMVIRPAAPHVCAHRWPDEPRETRKGWAHYFCLDCGIEQRRPVPPAHEGEGP